MTPIELKQKIDAFYGMPNLAIAVTLADEEVQNHIFHVEMWRGGGDTNVSVLVPIESTWPDEPHFERRYLSEAIETLLNDGVSEKDAIAANRAQDVELRVAASEVVQ